jgi:hypothetical protein
MVDAGAFACSDQLEKCEPQTVQPLPPDRYIRENKEPSIGIVVLDVLEERKRRHHSTGYTTCFAILADITGDQQLSTGTTQYRNSHREIVAQYSGQGYRVMRP